MYVPLAAADVVAPETLADLEALDLLALDDLEHAAGDAAWERRLFEVFNDTAPRAASTRLASRAPRPSIACSRSPTRTAPKP